MSELRIPTPEFSQPFDRLPPHSIEAEMCLLGSMMLDKHIIGDIVTLVDRDSFYRDDHVVVFEVLIDLYQNNRPIDAVVVREELNKRGRLEEVGGTAYLGQLLNSVPSAAHAPHYAKIVREKALLRSLISAAGESLREAYAPHESAEHVLDRAEKRIFEIAEKKVSNQVHSLGDVAMEVYNMLEERGRRGVETGFFEIDDMLNGMQDGELIIVAARPSVGKTAFGMNIIEHVSANSRLPTAVFSLEMSRQQLAQRMLCSRAGIDAQKVRRGMCQPTEVQKLAAVVNELYKVTIMVDDTPGLTVLDLRAKARRLKQQHDIKCLMIDYMQLMDNPGPESRQQQISEISRGIKAVARELSIPVICLSQLNRATEGREGHRPRMSDLRESGSIEQDADVVMLLHREDYYRMSDPNFEPDNIAEIIIAKQRNGPTGTVKLTFDNRTTTFKNLSGATDPF
ncbi:MAG TPA: replicative DNA helicase, partial [Tepidisphaeraceae bacterium]|nr:replicative DNA helicase [Tepidisphaeraceae bacterium]